MSEKLNVNLSVLFLRWVLKASEYHFLLDVKWWCTQACVLSRNTVTCPVRLNPEALKVVISSNHTASVFCLYSCVSVTVCCCCFCTLFWWWRVCLCWYHDLIDFDSGPCKIKGGQALHLGKRIKSLSCEWVLLFSNHNPLVHCGLSYVMRLVKNSTDMCLFEVYCF